MKVRSFVIDTSHLPSPAAGNSPQAFNVRTLGAYAVDHAELQYNGQVLPVDGNEIEISGEILQTKETSIEPEDLIVLRVFYVGVRDYSLLFPDIKATDQKRAERMGQYFQEAETSFESQAWLSLMLMCGSIFEHLLYFRLGCPPNITTLNRVSKEAKDQNMITADQYAIVDRARRARNVIHCNRLSEPYITRAEAMDAWVLIEKLILRL